MIEMEWRSKDIEGVDPFDVKEIDPLAELGETISPDLENLGKFL
jgi:hypothetical protein